ncbi:MAG TPA: hypothetical protein VF703_11125 [Pyrinomonadaceae bacterium]|jgi:uroporphyrinogen-III synthase
MRKDDSTQTPPVRPRREQDGLEPLRQWSNLPVSEERAAELIDEITRYGAEYVAVPLIELICGLMPSTYSDNIQDLDQRRVAGSAALTHAFALTRRAHNELGAYVVELNCAQWE